METVAVICALTALASLSVSLAILAAAFTGLKNPDRGFERAARRRKKSPGEREAEKEERLFREGIESILGYWPVKKEGGQSESDKR